MKINIQFTNKEASLLAKVMKKYDFTNRINPENLTNKYHEGNSAGHFNYSGISAKGANIEFESHEKLMIAACNVYLKYADSVNGIICSLKSLVVSCKGLFKNFISDYSKELNNAFAEIEADAKAEKAAKKAAAKADYEARAKHVREVFKKLDEAAEDDDNELY